MAIEKTKEELKRDKASRILTMTDSAITMLEQLEDDVKLWSSDAEISAEVQMKHQMRQNETCANLQFLIDYLQNRRIRS